MLDRGLDQAAGLRAMMPPPSLGVLAFPLATGGDERWIAQLAQALRALGRRPVVVDAARGTVASAFGLRLRHDLIDLMHGEHDFEDVAQATASGVYVLRADRGVEAFVASGAPASRLLGSFARLSHGFDDLLLAMPAEELACMMTSRALAFDTTDTIIIGEGTISLRDETLNLKLRPRPKDRSLFSFRSPLYLTGTFKQPSFRPDMKRVGLRAALALALGNIAPPAALLATLELGGGKDADCGGHYAR